jgi:hypothetical protein
MIKMEILLFVWIKNQVSRRIPLSKMVIQAKAKDLFDYIKSSVAEFCDCQDESFQASNGWFEKFKTRANIHSVHLKGEAASADIFAAEKYPEELRAIISEGGYDKRQIFNVDETGFFWKCLPNKTFISRMESSAPGYKVCKDKLTLLLGGNANGDLKFKPFLIYQSENPRALKGCSKSLLPVHWRSNKKAWMTAAMFQNWVITCAIPEIKAYCIKKN